MKIIPLTIIIILGLMTVAEATFFLPRTSTLVPVNIVVPSLSSTTPSIGTAETTVNGTWLNSPTSYNYQWRQGDTSTLIGTNSSSYTPAFSDVNHTLMATVQACNSHGCGSANSSQTGGVVYVSNFPLTEAPIYQGGGVWSPGVGSGSSCLIATYWGCVQTLGGFASGSGNAASYPNNEIDSTAILLGTWSADQQAQGIIHSAGSAIGGDNYQFEVELRLRTAMQTAFIPGYEINCSIVSGTPYIQIGRWDSLTTTGGIVQVNGVLLYSDTTTLCNEGDVVSASFVGNTITIYKNGSQIATETDSTYPTGSPGISFWNSNSSTSWSDLGWEVYTASNYVGAPSITAVNLSNNTFSCGVTGVVGTITLSGSNYQGAILQLSGTNANQFSLSSPTLPSNLMVTNATTGCPGSYSISITATSLGSQKVQAETITGS